MTEEGEREAVVAAARGWIGTPFHDGAALKGVGVDCAQLVRAVALETGLRTAIEPTGVYSHQWMLHRDDDRLVEFIKRYAGEVAEGDAREGDLVVYRVGRAFAHVAILSGGGKIVHAHKTSGCVIETGIGDYDLGERDKRWFSPWRRDLDTAAG